MKAYYLLLAGTALTLSACGNSNNASNSTASATASTTASAPANAAASDQTDLYKRLTSGGTITVGTEGTYPPFTYHDESGKLTGYDVEVTRAVAAKLGVQVDFKETQWDAMLAGLDAKRFDAVANQVSLTTPERQAKYDKSFAYSWSGPVLVAPVKVTDLANWESIKGKKSAQSLSSNYAEMATKYGAEIIGVEGLAQAVELVRTGRADVTLNDHLAVLDYLKKNQNSGLEIKLTAPATEKTGSGIIFRKGEDAANAKVSEAIEALQKDGTLAKLSNQFFGQDISKQ
ncbi:MULTISPECIES: transporter substrate-binding domain-containing protein [unclassified Acinetobacter]|uniref:transporter substrate-binding domain-containing protein n=1 Tax=unclassified Acinetobacter TaxID=196816 RepID=UPI0035BADFBD